MTDEQKHDIHPPCLTVDFTGTPYARFLALIFGEFEGDKDKELRAIRRAMGNPHKPKEPGK